jgi:hypothetical protein
MKEQSCDEQLDGLEGRKWQQQARDVLVFCRSEGSCERFRPPCFEIHFPNTTPSTVYIIRHALGSRDRSISNSSQSQQAGDTLLLNIPFH